MIAVRQSGGARMSQRACPHGEMRAIAPTVGALRTTRHAREARARDSRHTFVKRSDSAPYEMTLSSWPNPHMQEKRLKRNAIHESNARGRSRWLLLVGCARIDLIGANH
ncbi:hypothetical protein QZM46_04305 [Burkholderia vietnamiensis]|uniref:hypothetical protein n=1 Tax=Burkholderia vietnamiensis TaxID=60552 RepID=UPI00265510E5|nr:hypothetical protein [Burkholderia vietnamiensis]MDN7550564.1 hypothetical protein [Burkholderia vietnamiensis]HDR9094931.1 hypothetical protein [Burkholderia vietnamiensis]HDR9125416.1 hypothetical protein [Burkholderia vietnamiensis]